MREKIEKLFYDTFSFSVDRMEEISAHGSSRRYFRCISGAVRVLAAYNADRKENMAFVDYAEQLRKKGINVPDIYAVDMENGIYLLEDLGDETLFDFISASNYREIEDVYTRVVRILPKIQVEAGKGFDYTNAYPRKDFDSQSIQWDLNYFKYYFLKLADIPFNEEELEKDFASLKDYLLDCDCSYFMYRDFQSRNIMLKDGDIYFIDFQGARRGALQYDLASLLYDAKANLSEQLRKKLLSVYLEELGKYVRIDEKEFTDRFYAYVYIRIMQAMGSYGYRGYFQKKEHFLKSIPFALKNLSYLQDNVVLPVELKYISHLFRQMICSEKLRSLSGVSHKLTVRIKSFSYKKGYPHDVSGNGGGFVFDCRALPNPGRYDKYKYMTGMDDEVREFLEGDEQVEKFYENVLGLVRQSCGEYLRRQFTSLSVYFGCTGGQHRSVYFACRLARELSSDDNLNVILQHVEQDG